MDKLKETIAGQYGAGLMMLRPCIELCPDNIWLSGEPPREVWRIAYHALYYTHLYLAENQRSFKPIRGFSRERANLWGTPKGSTPTTKEELLDYLDFILSIVPERLSAMDLDAPDAGFSYYPGMPKLTHQMVNLRHLQGHVGQLSEILMRAGILTPWIGEHRLPSNS